MNRRRYPLYCQHFDLRERLTLQDDTRSKREERRDAWLSVLICTGAFYALYFIAEAVKPLLDW